MKTLSMRKAFPDQRRSAEAKLKRRNFTLTITEIVCLSKKDYEWYRSVRKIVEAMFEKGFTR
jgi:hypothetical protein